MNTLDSLSHEIPKIPDSFKAERQLPTTENLALWESAKAGDLVGLEKAIKEGGNPDYLKCNEDGKPSSLHAAADVTSVECTKELIQNGADVNVTLISNLNTPLHVASSNGAVEVCEILIRAGATINSGCKNAFGNTPLHAATRVGSVSCVDLLIQEGSDINAVNNRGSTALHFCSFLCGTELKSEVAEFATDSYLVVASSLILGGIDVNKADENGYTALHVAAQRGSMSMVKLLVDSGAMLALKTKKDWKGRGGRTPAEMAEFGDNTKVLAFLIGIGKQMQSGDMVATRKIAKGLKYS